MGDQEATTPSEDVPSIAEKVRFWAEQDRINQELIPRVLKLHQLFTGHVENHQEASAQISALEARFVKRERRIELVAIVSVLAAAAISASVLGA